jgi:protein PhnA
LVRIQPVSLFHPPCAKALRLIAPRLQLSGIAMSDVRDSNGTALKDGDSVTLIKDLKVKGTSVTLKRGTLVKNIRLTDDPGEIECNAEKVKGLVLKTEFLKRA